jgi:hypothetical protein
MKATTSCPVCNGENGIVYYTNSLYSLVVISDGVVWQHDLCVCPLCQSRIVVKFNKDGDIQWSLASETPLAETPYRAMDLAKLQHLVELVRGQAASIKKLKKQIKRMKREWVPRPKPSVYTRCKVCGVSYPGDGKTTMCARCFVTERSIEHSSYSQVSPLSCGVCGHKWFGAPGSPCMCGILSDVDE